MYWLKSALSVYFLLIMWGVSTLFGQSTEEVAYFSNGWVLRGEVDQVSQVGKVIVKTRDGNEFVLDVAELDSIATEAYYKPGKLPFVYKPKGHTYFGAIGIHFTSANAANWQWGAAGLSLRAGYNYRINPYLGIGAVTGLDLYNRGFMMPVALDIRGDIVPRKQTLFYVVQGGYGFRLYDIARNWWNPEAIRSQRGGIFYAGGAGVKFHGHSGVALTIALLYQAQHAYEFLDWGERSGTVETRHVVRRLGLQLGTNF